MNASHRLHKLPAALLVALAAAALGPACASARVTIGAGPAGSPTENVTPCNVYASPPGTTATRTCSIAILRLEPAAQRAPGGLTSPIDGVITNWRVNVGDGTGTLRVRPRVFSFSGTTVTGRNWGIYRQVSTDGGAYEFPDRVSIAAGAYVGLDALTTGTNGAGPKLAASIGTLGDLYNTFEALNNQETDPYTLPASSGQDKLLVSTDIEADADGDDFGDETQDLCPTRVDLQTNCPLEAGPPPAPLPAKPLLGKPSANVSTSTIELTSDMAGSVKTSVARALPGRKSKGKCSSRAKRGKKCTAFKTFAEFENPIAIGKNSFSYANKVGGKRLAAGKYRATMVVTSSLATSTTTRLTFTVRPKKK